VWRITDPQHPEYKEPPQISPVDPREPLPLYLGNSDKSCSSASAIDSPPRYQGRDHIADDFTEAVAQLAASREPIAPTHTNIEDTMHRGNPVTADLHIASAATAITYPAQYTFQGGSGSGSGSGGGGDGGSNGGGNPDIDLPMNNNDPDNDGPDLPGGGGGGPMGGAGQPAYNLDEHP
jgi:hypothetical protein